MRTWPHRYSLAAIAFFAFAAIQLTSSASTLSFYPFSPYRMFSKNWKSGIEMEQILVKSGNHFYRPWELMKIPFFQANSIAFTTFLDDAPFEQREIVCSLYRKNIAGSERIKIIQQHVRYSDGNGMMNGEIIFEKEVWACR